MAKSRFVWRSGENECIHHRSIDWCMPSIQCLIAVQFTLPTYPPYYIFERILKFFLIHLPLARSPTKPNWKLMKSVNFINGKQGKSCSHSLHCTVSLARAHFSFIQSISIFLLMFDKCLRKHICAMNCSQFHLYSYFCFAFVIDFEFFPLFSDLHSLRHAHAHTEQSLIRYVLFDLNWITSSTTTIVVDVFTRV